MSGVPTDYNYIKHFQINWTHHRYPIILSASISDQHIIEPVAWVQLPTSATQILSLSSKSKTQDMVTLTHLKHRLHFQIEESTSFNNRRFSWLLQPSYRSNQYHHQSVWHSSFKHIYIELSTQKSISVQLKITVLLITLNCFIRIIRTSLQKKQYLVITMWIQTFHNLHHIGN